MKEGLRVNADKCHEECSRMSRAKRLQEMSSRKLLGAPRSVRSTCDAANSDKFAFASYLIIVKAPSALLVDLMDTLDLA